MEGTDNLLPLYFTVGVPYIAGHSCFLQTCLPDIAKLRLGAMGIGACEIEVCCWCCCFFAHACIAVVAIWGHSVEVGSRVKSPAREGRAGQTMLLHLSSLV